MKQALLSAIALLPMITVAAPPVGSPAPDVVVYDTSGISHNLISESRGQVIHIFFCWSG